MSTVTYLQVLDRSIFEALSGGDEGHQVRVALCYGFQVAINLVDIR